MRAVVSEGNELFFEDAFDTTSGAAEAIKIDLDTIKIVRNQLSNWQ